MCSSICSADKVCNAYKYLPGNCSLLNATGLLVIGAEKSHPNAETVMINADLVNGNIYWPPQFGPRTLLISKYDPLTVVNCGMGECPTLWTKINQQENGVEWGTKNDEYGAWQVASKICGRKLRLQHRSGKITYPGDYWSYYGFGRSLKGEWWSTILTVFVTKGKGSNNVIVPYAGDPKITISSRCRYCYSHPVYNSMSTIVEFDLPLSNGNSYFCFEEGTEYQLWHGEDLYDAYEHDNSGTSYTDIYIIS